MSTLNKVVQIKSKAVSAVQVSASELISAKTVLIVEDDICCSMSLQLMLQYYGCRVLSASTCDVALELLRSYQKNIFLIFLDIMMPDKTGIDFLIETKSEGLLADIPVVIQSAEGNETIQKALDKGACGYVHKPYIKEEISRILTNLTKCNIPALQAFGFSHFKVRG